MRLVIVGNPDNRRVSLFRAAARAQGLGDPRVVPWRDVAAGVPVRVDEGSVVRIDSPGEDPEVDRLLRGAHDEAERGEIVGLAPWYRGFMAALGRVEAAAQGSRLLSDPAEVAVLFDKRACHARLLAAGVPVPPALEPPRSYAHLVSLMDDAGWTRVFVKPVHGSSASGVIALRRHGTRVRATTSVELADGKLYNSLRVRDYGAAETASIVDRLAPDGLHLERWFPKADLDGRVMDMRVVVIAGRPSHVVVRTSSGPITNLHLGGARGCLAEVQARAGRRSFRAAMEACERVAQCFPRSLQVGVDLMFSSDWSRHAVAEVNAFGDLLPGLLVDGRDTYAAQIAALAQGVPA